jgi:hypothetical protein
MSANSPVSATVASFGDTGHLMLSLPGQRSITDSRMPYVFR